ncbi:MAG: cofactor-independent phosphoglycerate mutase [Acidobacteria bacterium]|nr:cofactor-independent phosphoglycerate mutase [Acidobacteriota bacterium]
MKYALLVGDGMADWPIPELNNRTPLECAQTPNMDRIVAMGTIGMVSTIPSGMQPGSDVANLALLGYDPVRYYSGRAPFEAASMGIKLGDSETAFRCNLVTIDNETMIDYSAGHITTEEAHRIIRELQEHLTSESIRFYPGVSYRHLTICRNFPDGTKCTPPHDITGKPVQSYLPQADGSELLMDLMRRARELLKRSPVNEERRANGKSQVTDIWLWGQGRSLSLPTVKQRYGLKGSVISAVDLVRGLGVLAGLKIRMVDGATGYLGTNYAGKMAAARAALADEDFVYLHVEAPDETGHEGIAEKKIKAIEEFDRHIVGEMLRFQKETGDLRILVAPDHATPLAIKTHSSEPVPYAICGPGIDGGKQKFFSEAAAKHCPPITGPELFERFVK